MRNNDGAEHSQKQFFVAIYLQGAGVLNEYELKLWKANFVLAQMTPHVLCSRAEFRASYRIRRQHHREQGHPLSPNRKQYRAESLYISSSYLLHIYFFYNIV